MLFFKSFGQNNHQANEANVPLPRLWRKPVGSAISVARGGSTGGASDGGAMGSSSRGGQNVCFFFPHVL